MAKKKSAGNNNASTGHATGSKQDAPSIPTEVFIPELEIEDCVFYARTYLYVIRQAMVEPFKSEGQNNRRLDIIGAMTMAMDTQFDRLDEVRERVADMRAGRGA